MLRPPSEQQFLLCRIEHVKDTKVEHAATFIIQREDHTVGNAVRM